MAYADTPPRVVYELTELDLSLHDIICAMKDWGDALRDEILKPRTSALVDQQREHPAGGVEE